MSTDLLRAITTETRLRLESPYGRKWDVWFLFAITILVGVGLVMLYSASAIMAAQKLGDQWYLVRSQTMRVAAGYVMLFIGLQIDYRWYRRLIHPLLVLAFSSLLLVLLFGVVQNGSQRWFSLFGVSFQPSELAKIVVVMYLAYAVSKKKEMMRNLFWGVIPILGIVGLFVGLLMLQPDFGTSVILISMMFLFFFVSGTQLLTLGGFILAGGFAAFMVISSSPYRMKRIMAFLDPWQYRTDIGYQISESLIAIGSGGLTGKGLGNGMGKLGYVPELWSDFIGTIIAEELGLLGVIALVSVFLFVLWRGLRIAMHSEDEFGKFLAFGITALFSFQTAANLFVITGLAPTKGLTLPFVSLGGSSMIFALFGVGILLNISKNAPDTWEQGREEREARRAEKEWSRSRDKILKRRKRQR